VLICKRMEKKDRIGPGKKRSVRFGKSYCSAYADWGGEETAGTDILRGCLNNRRHGNNFDDRGTSDGTQLVECTYIKEKAETNGRKSPIRIIVSTPLILSSGASEKKKCDKNASDGTIC